MSDRCGKCKNCLDLEHVKKRVLACVNPPFSSATSGGGPGGPRVLGTDYGVTEVWNEELKRLPCTGEPASALFKALRNAQLSGQSEARTLAQFVWDLEEREPGLVMACMDEFIDWAGSIKDAVREDHDLPTQGEMWSGRRET